MIRTVFRDGLKSPDMQTRIVTFLVVLIIMTVLLRFLWNKALVPHVTILKPVSSLWQMFLLATAISLFH